jgi:hypothetical protein
MSTKARVPEGTLCDHCHDAESPLTESNSAHIFQRDWDRDETTQTNVHRECVQAWAHKHGGTFVPDEPLPPRPPCLNGEMIQNCDGNCDGNADLLSKVTLLTTFCPIESVTYVLSTVWSSIRLTGWRRSVASTSCCRRSKDARSGCDASPDSMKNSKEFFTSCNFNCRNVWSRFRFKNVVLTQP